MRRLICVCILLATILFPTISFAWNDTGHMTVALIAYRQLSDHQKQQIADLLKQHPHYALYLSAQAPQGVNVDEWAFIRAATSSIAAPSAANARSCARASFGSFRSPSSPPSSGTITQNAA